MSQTCLRNATAAVRPAAGPGLARPLRVRPAARCDSLPDGRFRSGIEVEALRALQRMPAAILVVDAVGYSSLMSRDERGTHEAFISDLEGVIAPAVRGGGGRVVKQTGDGVLSVFDGIDEAVGAAVAILGFRADAETAWPTRLSYRIGINLGEIIVEPDDVYGNDVNIAARLEGLAAPGSFTLSGAAYWAIKARTAIAFEELGFLQLKNITEPVQVYHARRPGGAQAGAGRLQGTAPAMRIWSEAREFHPEIVVLPFDNLSGEAGQDYFCDGLTNDLTTDLSRFANLFVISANTAFTYKNRHPRHDQLLAELGVAYMVEGSVQRLGSQLRINAQLIETRSGRHVWADRYQTAVDDIFSAQDALCHRIVNAVMRRLGQAEAMLARRKAPEDANAYEAFLKGMHALGRFLDGDEAPAVLDEAQHWYGRAIELDGRYARASGWLSYQWVLRWQHGWCGDDAVREAERLALLAVELDGDDHDTHWALASFYSNTGNFPRALAEYEQAIGLNRNDADLHAEMAELHSYQGDHVRAIGQVKFAMRMNPVFPNWYRWTLSWCYYFIHAYEDAIAELEKVVNLPDEGLLILAASYARLAATGAAGERTARRAKAGRLIEVFEARRPGWTLDAQRRVTRMGRAGDVEHWIEGLRLAGLGEGT